MCTHPGGGLSRKAEATQTGRHLPDSSELKKANLFPRSRPTHPLSPPPPPPASREKSAAGVGQKASKPGRRASSLIKAPTPKRCRFAPRPTHLRFTAGRWVPEAAAGRAQEALASSGGGDGRRGGRGSRGGSWRSAVPGRGDVAAAGLAAAAGVSGTRDQRGFASGPRLRARPRTCCCRRRARAPPCAGASPQGVRAEGSREDRRGKGAARGLGPSLRGFQGPSGRASRGAAPSAPRRPGEGAPTPRASSRPHHRLQKHPGPRASPKAASPAYLGLRQVQGSRPRTPRGPALGRRMLCRAGLRRPPR